MAPKSNAVTVGIDRALADVRAGRGGAVPAHLRDAHYPGAQELGHGAGYLYPHDFPHPRRARHRRLAPAHGRRGRGAPGRAGGRARLLHRGRGPGQLHRLLPPAAPHRPGARAGPPQYAPAQITLAEELIGLVLPGADPADSRVFLANSGTEANEGAFKIARRHGGAQRPRVLALTGAFHGRTMGSLALTHKAAYREPFEPLPGGVEFVPAGDGAALAAAMGPDVAALIVEPIQGEAGVRELPPGYLEAARELTGRAGALLIIDEVQTGMGRTGAWMAHHLLAPSVTPDVVTLAKGLGGGVPIGAVVATGPAAGLLGPGQHGTTFGGNPVACAAALAVIATIRDEGLLERAGALGARWSAELAAVPGVTGVRGRGLLRGVGLADAVGPAADVAAELMERGFIVNAPRPDTLRLAPPLIFPDADADRFTEVLRRVLADDDLSSCFL